MLTPPPSTTPPVAMVADAAEGGLVLLCGKWVEEGLKLCALAGADDGFAPPPDRRAGRGGVTLDLGSRVGGPMGPRETPSGEWISSSSYAWKLVAGAPGGSRGATPPEGGRGLTTMPLPPTSGPPVPMAMEEEAWPMGGGGAVETDTSLHGIRVPPRLSIIVETYYTKSQPHREKSKLLHIFYLKTIALEAYALLF